MIEVNYFYYNVPYWNLMIEGGTREDAGCKKTSCIFHLVDMNISLHLNSVSLFEMRIKPAGNSASC